MLIFKCLSGTLAPTHSRSSLGRLSAHFSVPSFLLSPFYFRRREDDECSYRLFGVDTKRRRKDILLSRIRFSSENASFLCYIDSLIKTRPFFRPTGGPELYYTHEAVPLFLIITVIERTFTSRGIPWRAKTYLTSWKRV